MKYRGMFYFLGIIPLYRHIFAISDENKKEINNKYRWILWLPFVKIIWVESEKDIWSK